MESWNDSQRDKKEEGKEDEEDRILFSHAILIHIYRTFSNQLYFCLN